MSSVPAGLAISGTTRLAAVIGWPVRHSLSPAMHNAAFAALGADWRYVAFEVPAGEAIRALDAMRALGIGGLSVTMPHKEAIAEAVDELDPAAAALHSANTVVPVEGGLMRGYSTDGAGFVASLRDEGIDPAGLRVVVVGAGAAGRSVIDALARAGVAAVSVVNRSEDRAGAAAALAGPLGRVGTPDDIVDADLVVNATSIGMGGDELPLDRTFLRPQHIVADLVYHPLDTALLAAARAIGARTVDGLGMLVHQAVLQQELWLGVRPDPAVMRAAAVQELAARARVA
jgi:shikimate dehydrogenase